jgi:hypothetical protein
VVDAHRVVAAYWAAAAARDGDAFGAMLAAGVVYEAPQTRSGSAAGPAELPASRAHLVERY